MKKNIRIYLSVVVVIFTIACKKSNSQSDNSFTLGAATYPGITFIKSSNEIHYSSGSDAGVSFIFNGTLPSTSGTFTTGTSSQRVRILATVSNKDYSDTYKTNGSYTVTVSGVKLKIDGQAPVWLYNVNSPSTDSVKFSCNNLEGN